MWWFLPKGLSKLGLTLLMAAAIGNFLSFLYPPFRIIDFIYLRLTARRYVVFNVADLYVPVGFGCLIVAAARFVLRRLRRFQQPVS